MGGEKDKRDIKIKEHIKIIEEKLIGIYTKYYVLIWVGIVGIIWGINLLLLKKFPPIKNVGYIQAIFLGFITFCVPFLWNVYQRIIEIKSKSIGEDVESILNKEFYKRLDRSFFVFLLLPLIIFLFSGLVLGAYLSRIVILVLITITLFLIINLPNVYRWIENRSSVNLIGFIKSNKLDNEDVVKIYECLFKKTDIDIDKEFNNISFILLELYTEKLKEIISVLENRQLKDKETLIKNINKFINILNEYLDQRSMLNICDVMNDLLNFHFEIWRMYPSYGEKERILYWRRILNILGDIFCYILKKIPLARNRDFYISIFFPIFVNHISEKQTEKIETISSQRKQIQVYAKEILSDKICEVLFSEYFSKLEIDIEMYTFDWKIRIDSLRSDRNIVSEIFLNYFKEWILKRIWNPQKEVDVEADLVIRKLFPSVEPIIWSRILIFACTPFEGRKKIEWIINRPWTIGNIGRIYAHWVGEGKQAEEQENRLKEETFKLAKFIFKDIFTKENIDNYLKEINDCKEKYKDDEEKMSKLIWLEYIFKEMNKYNEDILAN